MSERISISNAVPLRTAAALRGWLTVASGGEVSVYHHGLLSADVEAGARGRTGVAALIALARAAQQASDDGLVHLVQLRLSPGPFAYLAVRRSHEPAPPAAPGPYPALLNGTIATDRPHANRGLRCQPDGGSRGL